MDGQEQITGSNQPQPTEVSFEPIVWETAEFEVHRRDWRWYTVALLVLVIVLVYAVYMKQWMFAVTMLVLAIVIWIVGRAQPRSLRCSIDAAGFHINDQLFAYDQLKLFWFHRAGGKLYLSLLSTSRTMPTISVSLPDDYAEKARAGLSKFLPESDTRKDDWLDRLGRILKI